MKCTLWLIAVSTCMVGGCVRSPEKSVPAKEARLETPIDAHDIDVGVLPSGGSASTKLKIRNVSAKTCEVQTCETSCSCVSVRMEETKLASLAETYVRLDVDLSTEPDFVGELQVEACGKDRAGVEVMHFFVHISVVARTKVEQLKK